MSRGRRGTTVVIRHDLGRTVAVVVWVGAVAAVMATWPPSVPGVLVAVGASALVWVLCWRPAVVVDDDGVTIRNPLRGVRIGWAALDDVDFDWSLRLQAGGVSCRAAAAPGPASMGALYDRSSSAEGLYERAAMKDVGRRMTPALAAVRQRWAAHRHAGSTVVVVTRPVVSVIALTCASAALVGAIVGALVTA